MSGVLVTNCGPIATCAGAPAPRTGAAMRDLGIVNAGALLVHGDHIAAVGPRAEVEALAGADTRVVDAGRRLVLPGFVDAHTHPVFAGSRAAEFEMRIAGASYTEIAAAGGGIRSTVRLTRAASEDELLDAAHRYRQWFLRGGTTTIEAKSGYGLSLDAELKMLRVIQRLHDEGPIRYHPTFLGAHEIPDEFRGNADRYLDLVIHDILPAVVDARLARSCDVFCEPTVFPVDQARRLLNAARDSLTLRVHADQFTADYGSLLAAECRATTADHLERTTDIGNAALLAAGVIPVLLPASAYTLGTGHYPDARAMIAAGLPVVLATDFNPGSSPTTSMSMVLSLACTQMKMTPAEAITAATINAACSLGRAAELGSLEPGKLADFVLHDCDHPRDLAYFFGREAAAEVYIGGRLALKR